MDYEEREIFNTFWIRMFEVHGALGQFVPENALKARMYEEILGFLRESAETAVDQLEEHREELKEEELKSEVAVSTRPPEPDSDGFYFKFGTSAETVETQEEPKKEAEDRLAGLSDKAAKVAREHVERRADVYRKLDLRRLLNKDYIGGLKGRSGATSKKSRLEIGQAVFGACKALNMSQRDLAEDFNLPQSTLSKYALMYKRSIGLRGTANKPRSLEGRLRLGEEIADRVSGGETINRVAADLEISWATARDYMNGYLNYDRTAERGIEGGE